MDDMINDITNRIYEYLYDDYTIVLKSDNSIVIVPPDYDEDNPLKSYTITVDTTKLAISK